MESWNNIAENCGKIYLSDSENKKKKKAIVNFSGFLLFAYNRQSKDLFAYNESKIK